MIERIARRTFLALIRIYQLTLAALLGGQCRFDPSCSHYAREAIEAHGAWRGLGLAVRRILRCHPFSAGGHDPVPLAGRPAGGRRGQDAG